MLNTVRKAVVVWFEFLGGVGGGSGVVDRTRARNDKSAFVGANKDVADDGAGFCDNMCDILGLGKFFGEP